MATPVNWMAPARSVLYFSINCGKMGARDNGPKPWAKDTMVEHAMAEYFQKGVQFCPRWQRSSVLCSHPSSHVSGFVSHGRKTYERVMLVVRRLGDEHTVRAIRGLDEMMFSDIHHDLGAWQDLDIELLLELMEHLRGGSVRSVSLSTRHGRPQPTVTWINVPPHHNSSPSWATSCSSQSPSGRRNEEPSSYNPVAASVRCRQDGRDARWLPAQHERWMFLGRS